MLNPDLDLEDLSWKFGADHRLRIENILPQEAASEIAQHLASQVAYKNMLTFNGGNAALTNQQLQDMSPEDRSALQQSLVTGARQGQGFNYHGLPIREDADPVLKNFLMDLNSAEVMEKIKQVTKSTKLTHADGQATRYLPGHFLTRHKDMMDTEHRKLAYVFSFTPAWHPDWGGLLQFYEENGTPRDAWEPGMNVLSIFDVKHIHSVSYVTPFAGAARLSITGWFHEGFPDNL